nr:hypothetical protein AMTR_s02100p00009220 [Ipomoea trifida]
MEEWVGWGARGQVMVWYLLGFHSGSALEPRVPSSFQTNTLEKALGSEGTEAGVSTSEAESFDAGELRAEVGCRPEARGSHSGREAREENASEGMSASVTKDPLRVIDGPLTRARAKQLQDTVGGLISARWDAAKKAKWVKDIHAQVSQHIARRNEQVARQVNKGRRKVMFNPGDWVWLHLRKSQFPVQRRSKLMPRGDGPFQVASRINDNAYKLALPREYGVSTSFNVSDLFPFNEDEADSGTNPSMEGGDVEDSKDPL